MVQTSINIQPCKLSASERHNKREKALSYVRPELSNLNEWYNTLDVHLKAYDARLRKLIKEKTGRACQAKSHPLHEAVVVIRPDTGMKDIRKLADAMSQRWGFHFVQLAIHKDEGSWKEDGTWKANYHAHMVFDKIDHETGKTIKTTAKDTAEMQDMCARILQMERGKKSDKKHLDALSYKIKAQEEQSKTLAEKNDFLLEAGKKRLQEVADLKLEAESEERKANLFKRIRDERFEKIKELSDEVENLKQEKEKTANEVEKMRSDASNLQVQGWKLTNQKKLLECAILRLEDKKNEVEGIIAQKEQAEKDIKSLKNMEQDLNMQLDVVTGEVVKQEGYRDSLKEEVKALTQERDKAKRETAAARESLQGLTANKDRVQNWKWGFNELIKLIQPILDAIKRFAHVDGRGARFTPREVAFIDFALGRDDKREERAARFTRWAEDEEEHPRLYGGYRYQCAGEHMKMIAKDAAGYYNSVQQEQGRGMGY